MSVVSGQEAPEFQGWKGVKNHQQGEYVPCPTALCECAFTGPTRLVTLLYPTPAGAACPVSRVSAARDVNSIQIELLLANGQKLTLEEPK